MEKREVHASVKDERLVEKRRTQMIKGAVTLLKKRDFIVLRRGKSLKPLVSV